MEHSKKRRNRPHPARYPTEFHRYRNHPPPRPRPPATFQIIDTLDAVCSALSDIRIRLEKIEKEMRRQGDDILNIKNIVRKE